MRPQRGPLPDTDVTATQEDVDKSGLVPLFQEFAHLGRGRPRKLPLRTLLIGLQLCTQLNGGRAEREHRLARFTEFVLDASVRSLKALLAELSDESSAVDATPIRTFARGLKSGGPELVTDPGAGWYVREGDHRDPDTPWEADATRPPQKPRKSTAAGVEKKPSLKKKVKYKVGYDATFVVTRDSRYDEVLEAIDASGSRRIRGLAAQTILLVFQLAHANRRKTKNWADSHSAACVPVGARTTDAAPSLWAAGAPPAIWHRPPLDQLRSPQLKITKWTGQSVPVRALMRRNSASAPDQAPHQGT